MNFRRIAKLNMQSNLRPFKYLFSLLSCLKLANKTTALGFGHLSLQYHRFKARSKHWLYEMWSNNYNVLSHVLAGCGLWIHVRVGSSLSVKETTTSANVPHFAKAI